MVGVRECPPAADGDEAGVADLWQDHGFTVPECICPTYCQFGPSGNRGSGGAATVTAMGSRPGHGNWDEVYADDVPPPWEIGTAQPALAALVDHLAIEEPVLDVGCGTGELAILVAEKGHRVVGIDCSERAITSARAKAANRAPDIEFQVADAEHLQRLDVRPRTVLDSGLLHNLDDPGRRGYVAGLERT
ncbi:MAG: class I SAM-dependent methyltransferase [Nocardioidaceae bacterium]